MIDSNAPNYAEKKTKLKRFADFYSSLSLDHVDHIDKNEAFSMGSPYWNGTDNSFNCIQYFYNGSIIPTESGMPDLEAQLLEKRIRLFNAIDQLKCLEIANMHIQRATSEYIFNINSLKMTYKSYRKSLKIKFTYEKNVSESNLVRNEKDWQLVVDSLEHEWPRIDGDAGVNMYSPRSLEGYVTNISKILEKVENENSLMNLKLAVLKSLDDGKKNRVRFKFETITFVVTICTFLILVYPSLTVTVKNFTNFLSSFGLHGIGQWIVFKFL